MVVFHGSVLPLELSRRAHLYWRTATVRSSTRSCARRRSTPHGPPGARRKLYGSPASIEGVDERKPSPNPEKPYFWPKMSKAAEVGTWAASTRELTEKPSRSDPPTGCCRDGGGTCPNTHWRMAAYSSARSNRVLLAAPVWPNGYVRQSSWFG